MEAVLEEELLALLTPGRVDTRSDMGTKKTSNQTNKKGSQDQFVLNALLSFLQERQSALNSSAYEEGSKVANSHDTDEYHTAEKQD